MWLFLLTFYRLILVLKCGLLVTFALLNRFTVNNWKIDLAES